VTKPAEDLFPLAPDDRARLNKVADLLAVDPDDRECFISTIESIVSMTSIRHRLFTRRLRDARLLVAAQAVRTAYGAVAKLTPRQKWQLGWIITGLNARPYWLPVDLPSEAEDNIAPALIEAVDAAFGTFIERSPHAASGKKGKQKGTKAQWAMHDFVLQLWDRSRQDGDVTLSNKDGQAGGSIVEVLGILKPMLPNQFFPGILSYSFLRKVQKSLPVNPAAEFALKLRRFRRPLDYSDQKGRKRATVLHPPRSRKAPAT
jgi:hypothetical protein